MIRGPVLPQARDALWALLAGRLDAIERGMTLVSEAFDCSGGQLGACEGLARDAAGAPVLLLLATDGDALLAARALAAAAFLDRVGDALATAVPEAAFAPGCSGRVVVVATDGAGSAIEALVRSPIPGLHVCRLEPFRVAGAERFAVRWLQTVPSAAAAHRSGALPAFAVPEPLQSLWHHAQELCLRIDAGIRVDGDRYRRRVTWNGKPLAEVEVLETRLRTTFAHGAERALETAADVRAFVDAVLRAYARLAGLSILAAGDDAAAPNGAAAAAPRSPACGRTAAGRPATDSLRATLASARLTPEEYSALGLPTSAVGGEAGDAIAGDDSRIVAARDGSWPQARAD